MRVLKDGTEDLRQRATDVLLSAVQHDATPFRDYFTKQPESDQFQLLLRRATSVLCCTMILAGQRKTVVILLSLRELLFCHQLLYHSSSNLNMHYTDKHLFQECCVDVIPIACVRHRCTGIGAQLITLINAMLQALVEWRRGQPPRDCVGDSESALGPRHNVSQGTLVLQ